LKQSRQVYCVLVFDRDILDGLPHRDRQVTFIHASVTELNTALRQLGGASAPPHSALPQEVASLHDLGFEQFELAGLLLSAS
jgi:deoxyribodipyrimidine photo-lyase